MQVRNSHANEVGSDSRDLQMGMRQDSVGHPFEGSWTGIGSWKLGAVNEPSLTRKERCKEVETGMVGAFHAREFNGCRSVEGDAACTN